jgi:hypothetical protein
VLKEKANSRHHGVSPSSHQVRLDSLLTALKNLADAGLGAASVLVNLHHWRIIPLMERELRIHEMSEAANPMLTVKIRQPSHEFTFGVGISFIPYPLVLTPVV